MSHQPQSESEPSGEIPLQGWKEIGTHLERDESTARRWERDARLPVRRHLGDRRSSVYAFKSEIDAWRARRVPAPSMDHITKAQQNKGVWIWGAAATVCVLGVGLALLLRSPSLGRVAEAGAGGGIRTTEICSNCDWIGGVSPDGRYLSQMDWVSREFGIVDLETGEMRALIPAQSSESIGESTGSLFSPDGKHIAYNWSIELGCELRVVEVFGESPESRRVYFNPEFLDIKPNAWTEDGRLLVRFQRRDWSVGFGFVSLETGDLSVVRSLNGDVSEGMLSRDLRWIAYDAPSSRKERDRDVHLIAADGSSARTITSHSATDFLMGFSPDSKTLLFASDRTGTYGLWGADISDVGKGGEPEILMRDIGSVSPMGVAPDGALIYARTMGSVDLYMAELDLETGRLLRQPRVIETKYQGSNRSPSVSPDGRLLAYHSSPILSYLSSGAKQNLVVLDRETGAEREYADDELSVNWYAGLKWSPDSSKIMLRGTDSKSRWGVYEVVLETGYIRPVHEDDQGENVLPVGWSQDGQRAIFRTSRQLAPGTREGSIEIGRFGEANWRRLYKSVGAGWVGSLHSVELSPQRDRVAWREKRTGDLVRVMPLDGGEARTVYHVRPEENQVVSGLGWTADGESLLVCRVRDGQTDVAVWIVPLDGSKPRKSDLSELRLRGLEMHPDGKTVFFHAGLSDRRIFRTENYLSGKPGPASE